MALIVSGATLSPFVRKGCVASATPEFVAAGRLNEDASVFGNIIAIQFFGSERALQEDGQTRIQIPRFGV